MLRSPAAAMGCSRSLARGVRRRGPRKGVGGLIGSNRAGSYPREPKSTFEKRNSAHHPVSRLPLSAFLRASASFLPPSPLPSTGLEEG